MIQTNYKRIIILFYTVLFLIGCEQPSQLIRTADNVTHQDNQDTNVWTQGIEQPTEEIFLPLGTPLPIAEPPKNIVYFALEEGKHPHQQNVSNATVKIHLDEEIHDITIWMDDTYTAYHRNFIQWLEKTENLYWFQKQCFKIILTQRLDNGIYRAKRNDKPRSEDEAQKCR